MLNVRINGGAFVAGLLSCCGALLFCSCTTPEIKSPVAKQVAKEEKVAVAKQPASVAEVAKQAPAPARAEAFKLVPRKNAGFVRPSRISFYKSYSERYAKDLKLPKDKTVMCSKLGEIMICMSTDVKSLIFDLNKNKDLTDDKVFDLPAVGKKASVEVPVNGNTYALTLSARKGRTGMLLTVTQSLWYEGHVQLDGQSLKCAVTDENLSGLIDDGDTGYLDFNGNGTFDPMSETIRVSTGACSYVAGRWLCITSSPDKRAVVVEPYAGPMHKVSFDLKKISEATKGDLNLTLYYGLGQRLQFKDFDFSNSIELPGRTYIRILAKLNLKGKPLAFDMRKWTLDKDVTLSFAKPKMNLSINQRNQTLSVGQAVAVVDSIHYFLKRGKKGPKIEVFAAGDLTKPLTQGNMKYG